VRGHVVAPFCASLALKLGWLDWVAIDGITLKVNGRVSRGAAVRVYPSEGKAGASYGLINIESMFMNRFKPTFGY
jgi:hypothetical protein